MAEIDISDAVGAGVRLITRKPLSVLAWGALPMAVFVAVFLLFGGSIIASIVAMAQNQGQEPRPEQILGLIGAMFGAVLILIVSLIVVSTVIRSAAIRSELEPDNGAWAYMRLGAQEFWVFASIFVMGVLIFVVQLVIGIPIAIVTGVAMMGTALSAGNQGAETVAGSFAGLIALRLVIQLLLTAVSLWIWLRLCMGPVMSFREREFRLFESWALTKGHVWRMFLVMLLAFLIILAIYFVLAIIGFVGVIAVIGATPGLIEPQTFSLRPPAQWLSALLPIVLIVAALGVVLVGCANALVYGAVARMYRQLNPAADPATAFA